jgi:hypothetical protein
MLVLNTRELTDLQWATLKDCLPGYRTFAGWLSVTNDTRELSRDALSRLLHNFLAAYIRWLMASSPSAGPA